MRKRKFSHAFFSHFLNFFSYFVKICLKSKTMLYKRSIGVGQTFPMSFQYDCLKFLLNEKK